MNGLDDGTLDEGILSETTIRVVQPPAKVPHFSFPVRIDGDSIARVEQDSTEEIIDCVAAAVDTRVGSRLEALDYGIPDPVFKQLTEDVSADSILRAAKQAEPRAQLLAAVEVDDLVERVAVKEVSS